MPYVATMNVPGYLPMMDNVEPFDDAHDAWEFLADQRRTDEDDAAMAMDEPMTGYSATLNLMESVLYGGMAERENAGLDPETGEGTIHGATPGRAGEEHDLGIAYSVAFVADEEVGQ